MECNRDEAERAKEIAEKKLSAKDYSGAKKFAAKAQNLFPGLEGISQMLDVLDVYVAAENKINGESDWCRVLGVDLHADDETVRKRYRKLALTLHPDKNKCVGAEGAFKLVSEAWKLLSDKAWRSAYNQRRNVTVNKQKVETHNGTSSKPSPGTNGFYNFGKSTSRTKTAPKNTNNNVTKVGSSSAPKSSYKPGSFVPFPSNRQQSTIPSSYNQSMPPTFWTVCYRCKMQFEFSRIYLQQNLLCPTCQVPFLAVEIPPPAGDVPSGTSKHVPDKNVGSASNSNGFHWGPFSKASGAAASAQAATMVQQAYERVKREREEAQAAKKREDSKRRKREKRASKGTVGVSSAGNLNDMKDKETVNHSFVETGALDSKNLSDVKQGNGSQGKARETEKPGNWQGLQNCISQLMDKARFEIHKRLNEWSTSTVSESSVEGVGFDENKEIEKEAVKRVRKKMPVEPRSIDVPDPDFHDFDGDRAGRCFGENQVWAAYDDSDGMPRYYAMIHKVTSVDPFESRISWLSSKTNEELGPVNWVSCGFAKTSGDFRLGKRETNPSINSFSHKISWKKGAARGTIQIYPRKGDVWALYRNWSPEWDVLTPNEVVHQYEIVEVEDTDDELGMKVVPLVKVEGFKTVFRRNPESKEVRMIPRGEIFRFSHQIPSYLLTGEETTYAPKGCVELDPAATPMEFLRVKADVAGGDTIKKDTDNTEKVGHRNPSVNGRVK